MNIHDAIMNPESDVEGSIVVLDIADSTAMKEETEEVGWLGNYAKAFDIIVQQIPASGSVVKYLGDGIMIFFRRTRKQTLSTLQSRCRKCLRRRKKTTL